jgi:hypothetical protein
MAHTPDHWVVPDDLPASVRGGARELSDAIEARNRGDIDAALDAAGRAVTGLREVLKTLAGSHSDKPHVTDGEAAALPVLVAALTWRAHLLVVDDQATEAGPAVDEAIALAARLTARDLLPFADRLVLISLNRLANTLSVRAATADALRAATEAARLARQLGQLRPELHPDLLALVLGTLATRQWQAGDGEQSVRTSAEALRLAARLPTEVDAFEHASIAAVNAAHHLGHLDRPREALQHAQVAVTAARWLLARSYRDCRQRLVLGLNALGNIQSSLGEGAGAAAAFAEAGALLQKLVQDGGEAEYGMARNDLLMVLSNASMAAEAAGDLDEARRHAEQALGHAVMFAEQDRDRFEPLLPGLTRRFWSLHA